MIVVTTPTGNVGSQVLDNLLDAGEPIRVITRDPSRLDPEVRERVEVVQGPHDEIEVVTEAFDGARAVFWLVPPDLRAESVEGHYLDFTRPACEAITRQGADRVVAVSTLGRGWSGDAGQLSGALAMDELIESTGVSYRALAMPFFMDNLLRQVEPINSQGTIIMANAADRPVASVATRDVAAAAAELLLDDSWSGQQSVPVVGSDDLSPEEMARVISEVLERPVRLQQLPREALKEGMLQRGMREAWAQGMIDMAVAQDQGIYDAQASAPGSNGPTSFRQWCAEVLKPAVLA